MTLRRGRRRKTGVWTRAGMARRTKEMWHVAKRSNMKQITGAIEILLDPDIGLNEKTWTGFRKETFNTELAKRGFTESGAPLSASGLRTLVALLKYLGLVYQTGSIIRVTGAGKYFLEKPKEALLLQMLKLQLTNPIVIDDCVGVEVFPFRATLRLLLEPELGGYLSYDEIGCILFMSMKHESDHNAVKESIIRFRVMDVSKREELLKEFKNSPEGQVTLAKAPSVNYYASLCVNTGLCDASERQLKIRVGKESETQKLLSQFQSIGTFDFGHNIDLWIQYYSNPSRLAPPRSIPVIFF